jgi:hypothetical protein
MPLPLHRNLLSVRIHVYLLTGWEFVPLFFWFPLSPTLLTRNHSCPHCQLYTHKNRYWPHPPSSGAGSLNWDWDRIG